MNKFIDKILDNYFWEKLWKKINDFMMMYNISLTYIERPNKQMGIYFNFNGINELAKPVYIGYINKSESFKLLNDERVSNKI